MINYTVTLSLRYWLVVLALPLFLAWMFIPGFKFLQHLFVKQEFQHDYRV